MNEKEKHFWSCVLFCRSFDKFLEENIELVKKYDEKLYNRMFDICCNKSKALMDLVESAKEWAQF